MVGCGAVVRGAEHAVALFKVNGEYFAIGDFCIRCGASLALGTVAGHTVRCSHCDWTYDLTNGRSTDIPSLRTDWFEVQVVGAKLMVATQPGEPTD